MSDKFVASNGITVDVDQFGVGFFTSKPHGFMTLAEDEMRAMREFFRAERDEELGRWRWPENPEYVVYPKQASEVESEPGVRVVNEASGRSKDISRDVVGFCPTVTTRAGEAAQAYFAAHPERKPWHDAKPDEVWKFTSKDRERKALAWRSWDDWDVLSPHGRQIRAVDDPIAALIENGYEEFAELASAVRMTEVSDVAE